MKIQEMAIDLLFPPRCPICDKPVRQGGAGMGLACLECMEKLHIIREPFCIRCGKPLQEEEQEYCADCHTRTHVFLRNRALYEYHSAASAIYRFKYGERPEYARFFGREMAKHLGDYIRKAAPDALIPVPLSAERLRQRGYNQATLLAREIGKELHIPVREDVLERIRNTAPQKLLNPGQRQNNLKKAFIIRQNDVKLSTTIIVDDIFTTGATVDAVAEALLQGSTEKVYALCLSIGEGC